jgi:ribonuclease PH
VRPDGRAPDELRPVRLETDFTEVPLASVLSRAGDTLVLCTVSETPGVPRFLEGRGSGWITAEYAMLPGATAPRAERETARGRPAARSQEIQRLVGRSLRAAADLAALGDRTLTVDCDVLQADGGTRCASITGGYAALAIALRRLQARGALERDPLRDAVAAVSVGIVDGEIRLDLPYAEDSRAAVDLNVVATGSGRLVEIQGTGEDGTFSVEQLDAMSRLALRGISLLVAEQRRAIAAARA